MKRIFIVISLFLSSPSFSATNFCQGKAANTYFCVNDTQMQHCTGNNGFVLKACPAKLCVTRTPATRNPCVGKDAALREDGLAPPVVLGGEVVPPKPQVTPPPVIGGDGVKCVGGPKFDPASLVNGKFGKGLGPTGQGQFITGQCKNNADCNSLCCAGPCGICSGPDASFQNSKTGCGFGG